MKVSTSRTILVALAVGFLGGMVLLALSGDAEARRDLPAQFLAWASIGAIVFAGWWFRVRPRRELHRDEAGSLGFRSAPGDPLHLLGRSFALLGEVAAAKDVENTSWGSWRGRDVVVFDYWYARSSDPQLDDYRYFTCATTPMPSWPELVIAPAGWTSTLARAVGMEDVRFEYERFNRAFDVRADDRRFATALVDGAMMEWLLELPPGSGFEIRDGTILCRTPRAPDRDVTRTLETMAAFLNRVPAVVRSWYGPSG